MLKKALVAVIGVASIASAQLQDSVRIQGILDSVSAKLSSVTSFVAEADVWIYTG